MWNDNETRIDLLGFDYLVDSLEILLTEEDLLPLTVGVLGDWGSGKSSLMQQAKDRLDAMTLAALDAAKRGDEAPDDQEQEGSRRPFITVAFSPWRYENYTQVKYALMDAVLDAIDEYIGDCDEDEEPREKLARSRRYLSRLKPVAAPATKLLIAGGAELLGIGSDVADVATTAAEAALPVGNPETPEAPDDEGDQEVDPDLLESIAGFHVEFEELLESISDVQAVVVFIDDMDRCEERAIIDTFETIRLFLNATKTVFVLGMNEPVIAAALETRYPEQTDQGDSRAKHYVEKMIQHSVAIPPLSEPEALTYVSLLFADKHLSSEQMDSLRQKADENRTRNPNAAAMNLGVAREVLAPDGSPLPEALERDLGIAAQVGGPLASGLRGNPRQIKRFLNRLQLRLRVAQKRSIPLQPQVMSKLMVLEETSPKSFETLFVWQNDNDGRPLEIEIAEAVVKGTTVPKAAPEVHDAAVKWANQPKVHAWLREDPSLVGTPLGPYFTFSRDRLKTSVRASRLSPEQQQLIADLQSPVGPVRKVAVDETLKDATLTVLLGGVLLEQFPAALDSDGSRSLVEIAAGDPSIATAFFEELEKVPAASVSRGLAMHLAAVLSSDERLHTQVQRWTKTTKLPKATAKAFTTYLKAR